MATTKKRLNISLTKSLESALEQLAMRDAVPQATKATQLLQVALEIEEDTLWDEIARKRDTSKSTFVSHNKAWQ